MFSVVSARQLFKMSVLRGITIQDLGPGPPLPLYIDPRLCHPFTKQGPSQHWPWHSSNCSNMYNFSLTVQIPCPHSEHIQSFHYLAPTVGMWAAGILLKSLLIDKCPFAGSFMLKRFQHPDIFFRAFTKTCNHY